MPSTSCRPGAPLSGPCAVLSAVLPRVPACVLAAVLGASSSMLHAAEAPPVRSQAHVTLDGVPPPDVKLTARLARYQHSRQASFLDWLPDGGILIATRFGEGPQVHRVARPLGDREQLTFGADRVTEARAQPTGAGFVFLAEQPGHGSQVYYWQGTAGGVRLITPGKAGHQDLIMAHDGKRVAFAGTERAVGTDVYIADVTGGTPRLLTQELGAWTPLDWSADDQHLLALKTVSPQESYLYSLDTRGGAATQLLPVAPVTRKASIRAARFAPDGRGIYVISDDGGEQQQLFYFDQPTNRVVRTVSPQLSWDVEDFAASVDGRYIAYVVNEDGISRLTVQDAVGRTDLAPRDLPPGRITGLKFDGTGRRLAFTLETAQQPRDVYVYDLTHSAVERWTHSEVGPIDPGSLAPAELVHYPTWDRVNGHARMLSAYLYRPRGSGPFPVLVSFRGGPEDQFRPDWDPFLQFLVNELGVAVVAPNVRGAGGYGRSFAALDDGVLRQDAVRDIGSLLVWLGLQSGFDRQHIAVMGSGYGGYLALSALAAYSDRLCAGIDVQGISDLASYLADEPVPAREQDRLEYGDERDQHTRAFLDRISPLHNIAQLRAPMLIVQQQSPDADAKAPPPQAQQLVWRLRSRGIEVWSVTAREGDVREAYLPAAGMFLSKLLGGKITDTASP